MKCSVCIATYNKAGYLDATLHSIFSQTVHFAWEVIVCDDGSRDDTAKVCSNYDLQYIRLNEPRERNPAPARNAAYRAARGKIIITQSDDVMHRDADTIRRLVESLGEGEFVLATVFNHDARTGLRQVYVGEGRREPLFFLGALWRRDLYAIGGNDEEFIDLGSEDNWFADCLTLGLKLKWRILPEVVGLHQDHPRGAEHASKRMIALRDRNRREAVAGRLCFCSSGGPWRWKE